MLVRKLARHFKQAPFIQSLSRWVKDQLLYSQFKHDFATFAALSRTARPRFALTWQDRYPCLYDKTPGTNFDHHYVYHTAWAARVIAKTRPRHHVDISSSLYFCSLVSAFVPVKFYDYRRADLHLGNLTSKQADLKSLPFVDASIDSLSCMHVVEHIGLGRYGEPLDPDGDLTAMTELKRVLAVGGSLLFVVPIGEPRLRFNAHRVYAYRQILDAFVGLQLRQFALIPDSGDLIEDASPQLADRQTYGCGCFWFQRTP